MNRRYFAHAAIATTALLAAGLISAQTSHADDPMPPDHYTCVDVDPSTGWGVREPDGVACYVGFVGAPTQWPAEVSRGGATDCQNVIGQLPCNMDPPPVTEAPPATVAPPATTGCSNVPGRVPCELSDAPAPTVLLPGDTAPTGPTLPPPAGECGNTVGLPPCNVAPVAVVRERQVVTIDTPATVEAPALLLRFGRW